MSYYTSLCRFGMVTLLAGALLAASGCASIIRPNYSQQISELRQGQYTIDPEHVYVHFRVGHLGLSTIVGRFNVVSASLDFDPQDVSAMILQGSIVSSSVDLNNADLEATLLEASWFDAENHPVITFASSAIEPGNDNRVRITGELNLRGISREVTLDAVFNGGADNILTGKYTLGFSATTQILRSDFGMDAFAALVGDQIEIELHGEFQKN